MPDCGCEMEAKNRQERKTLWIILGINAFMFATELGLGLLAESSRLIVLRGGIRILKEAKAHQTGLSCSCQSGNSGGV